LLGHRLAVCQIGRVSPVRRSPEVSRPEVAQPSSIVKGVENPLVRPRNLPACRCPAGGERLIASADVLVQPEVTEHVSQGLRGALPRRAGLDVVLDLPGERAQKPILVTLRPADAANELPLSVLSPWLERRTANGGLSLGRSVCVTRNRIAKSV
jgi:hypothetical protein